MDERRMRAVLPSGHVAEFIVPRIGDVMKLREDAVRACKEVPSLLLFGTVCQRIAPPRLLKGLSVDKAPEGATDEDIKALPVSQITDLQWDSADVGRLGAMKNAYPGTPEAEDWEAIAHLASELAVGAAASVPMTAGAEKKPTPFKPRFVT